LDINLYAVKINDSTDQMFNEMSEVYQDVAKKPILIEKLDDCQDKFAFFVAYSKSSALTSVSYSKLDFMKLIKKFKTASLESLGLSKDYDKLNGSEKSIVDFLKKINQSISNSEDGFEVIPKDSFDLFENTIKSEIIQNDLEYPEILMENYPYEDFNNISSIEINAVCHSFNIFKDLNTEINWKNPLIQQSKIISKIKLDLSPFSKGVMRYAYYMYDTFLDQKLVGKLPIKYKKQEYNLEFLSRDIESFIASDHLASEFNDRIINYVKDSRLL